MPRGTEYMSLDLSLVGPQPTVLVELRGDGISESYEVHAVFKHSTGNLSKDEQKRLIERKELMEHIYL